FQQSNMALCGIGRSPDRLKVVDFSSYVSVDEITYFLQRPKYAKRDWIVLEPFSLHIWAVIFAMFIACSLIRSYALPLSFKNMLFRLFAITISQCKFFHIQIMFTLNLFIF